MTDTDPPPLSVRPRRRRRHRAARARRRSTARRARAPRHRARRGLDAGRRRGQRRDVPSVGARRRIGATRRPEDDPYRDWECSNPLQLFDRLLDTQFVGPAPRTPPTCRGDRRAAPDLVVCSLFVVGGMVAAEAAGVPFDVVFPNAYLLPTPGMPPFGLGLKPAKGLPGRAPRSRAHPPDDAPVGQGAAAAQRAAHVARARRRSHTFFDQVHHARRHLVLTSADFDFPGDGAAARALRRCRARRPGVGRRRTVDAAIRRRAARARRPVDDVPGPGRVPATNRRRPRVAPGARRS